MIAVIGGAGMSVKVMMLPKEEEFEQPVMGDVFDYNSLNVAAKMARGDEITVESSSGALNIASHLSRMGKEVAMATVVAEDPVGMAVMEQLKSAGVNTCSIKKVEGSTPVRVELYNILKDPQMVFGNSKLYRQITSEVLKDWADLFDNAEAIVADGNLPKDALEYLVEEYGRRKGKKLFFDPSCYEGAVNSRDIIDGFYCVMPARVEAEAMLKRTVLSTDQLMEAGRIFEEKGVAKAIITIKGGGLYYKEGINEGVLAPERVLSFAATSGAGDVVSAAVVASDLEGKTIEETGRYAMAMAADFLKERTDERVIDKLDKNEEED